MRPMPAWPAFLMLAVLSATLLAGEAEMPPAPLTEAEAEVVESGAGITYKPKQLLQASKLVDEMVQLPKPDYPNESRFTMGFNREDLPVTHYPDPNNVASAMSAAEGKYWARLSRIEAVTVPAAGHEVLVRCFASEADAGRYYAYRVAAMRTGFAGSVATARRKAAEEMKAFSADMETRTVPGFAESQCLTATLGWSYTTQSLRRLAKTRYYLFDGRLNQEDREQIDRPVERREWLTQAVGRQGRVVVWSNQRKHAEERRGEVSYAFADEQAKAANEHLVTTAMQAANLRQYQENNAILFRCLADAARRGAARLPNLETRWAAWGKKRLEGRSLDGLTIPDLRRAITVEATEPQAVAWKAVIEDSAKRLRESVANGVPGGEARHPLRLGLMEAALAAGPPSVSRLPANSTDAWMVSSQGVLYAMGQDLAGTAVFGRLRSLLAAGSPVAAEERTALLTGLAYLDREGWGENIAPADFDAVVRLLGVQPVQPRWLRLDAEASPSSVPAGTGEARVTARLARQDGNDGAWRGVAGVQLTCEVLPVEGVQAGRIKDRTVTTDQDGRATWVFQAPKVRELREGLVTYARLRVRSARPNLEEELSIPLTTDRGDVEAAPNYGAATWSRLAVIPADRRFPATVSFHLVHENADQAGKTVTFRLASPERGLLETLDGKSGPSVEVLTGTDGMATVRYRYTGPVPAGRPSLERIDITSPEQRRAETAWISVGIDLALRRVTSGYDGKGAISAGERVPLVMEVYDRLHPAAADLTGVFRHWGGPAAEATLGVVVDAKPTGYQPDYLVERLSIAQGGNQPVHVVGEVIFDPKRNATLLKEPGASWIAIQPRYTGMNLFDVTAWLADGRSGKPMPDGDPANNHGVVGIQTGLAADAVAIFFVDDPFGPNTPLAAALRTVLDMSGYGLLLKPTEILARLNRGDIQGVVESVAAIALGHLTERLAKVMPEEMAKVHATLALIENTAVLGCQIARIGGVQSPSLATSGDFQAAGAARKIMELSGMCDRKVVTVTGDGGQGLRLRSSGKMLAGQDGKLTDLGDGAYCVRRGGVTVFLLPAGAEVEVVGGVAW